MYTAPNLMPQPLKLNFASSHFCPCPFCLKVMNSNTTGSGQDKYCIKSFIVLLWRFVSLLGECDCLHEEYFVLWPGDADRWLLPVQLKEHPDRINSCSGFRVDGTNPNMS